jgi:hypothetical protein
MQKTMLQEDKITGGAFLGWALRYRFLSGWSFSLFLNLPFVFTALHPPSFLFIFEFTLRFCSPSPPSLPFNPVSSFCPLALARPVTLTFICIFACRACLALWLYRICESLLPFYLPFLHPFTPLPSL